MVNWQKFAQKLTNLVRKPFMNIKIFFSIEGLLKGFQVYDDIYQRKPVNSLGVLGGKMKRLNLDSMGLKEDLKQ